MRQISLSPPVSLLASIDYGIDGAVVGLALINNENRLEVSKSREMEKGRVVCKSVKSAIITASALKATSQLAEMVLIILTQSKTSLCVCACFLQSLAKTKLTFHVWNKIV